MRSFSKKDTRFLRSAFGREYLPYIYGLFNRSIVKVPIGVIRKPMSDEEQHRWLPKRSVAIVSHCSLYHIKQQDKFPFCKKVKMVCTPFSYNPPLWEQEVPHFNLCESDMVDSSWVDSGNFDKRKGGKFRKKYDILIITEFNKKGLRYKGLQSLAFLMDIETELGLSVCILDVATKKSRGDLRSPSLGEYLQDIDKKIKSSKNKTLIRPRYPQGGSLLSQRKMNGIMQSSRCILIGNTADASPKITTEALIRGIPVIMNKNILGGSKYINENNGSLFDGGKDVHDLYDNYDRYKESLFCSIDEVFSKDLRSEKIVGDYYEKWGLRKSSERLARCVNGTFGTDYSHLFYPQFRRIFRK